MRKIKIKVKYLLLIALIIIGALTYIVPKAIYDRAKELENIDMEASKVLYKRYISMIPFSNKKADAMFKIANQIAPHEDVLSMYKITQFGSGFSGKMLTSEIVNNALEYYDEIYRNYPDNEAYIKSYKRLIDIYIVLGEHDKSKDLIEDGLKSTNNEMNFMAQKYNMFYLMLENKYVEAKTIGEELIKQKDKHYIGDVYIMLGDIYASDMNFEKAIECYKNQDNLRRSITNYPNTKVNDYIEFTVYNLESYSLDKQQQVSLLINARDIYKGKSDIHGKVIINGKPLAFAQVYLRDSRFTMLNFFSPGDKGYPIWTDAEGNYRIPKLPKGEYDIELDIPLILLANNRTIYQNRSGINKAIELSENESKEINFNFVPPINIEPKGTTQLKDNKVYIKWEKVEGAAYYYVNVTAMEDPIKLVGGSFYGPVSEKITATSYTLNIQDINKQSKGQSTSGDGLVNIQAYLGIFFSEFKIPFSVTAYDKNDNIISSSSAIQEKYENLHIMLIPKAELLEGDELLINKKPEEALKSYEKHLANNPKDIHTIEVLTRMYKIGIRNDWKDNKFEARDIYKALDLANRSYKLTGNIEEVKYVLSNIYMDFNNAKDYQWALQEILKLPKEEIKKEQYADLGYLYLRLKEFNKADESFNKAISMGYDYLYESPLLKLYLEDFHEALIITQDIKYVMYSVNKDNFIKGLKEIKDVDKASEDYKAFREILGSILSKENGYKEKYKEKNSKIKNTILNRIMLEIAKEQNLE
jgi:tetratricopeptide (TPR) repeat protein